MERAVDDIDFDIDDREAGDDAVGQGFANAFFNRGDEFLRNDTADDLVVEDIAFAPDFRTDDENAVTVLTAAAGLTDVFTLSLDFAGDGLAVGNLGGAGGGVNLELAAEPLDQNLEVELAHAGDDGLAGFVVSPDLEGRVFVGKFI